MLTARLNSLVGQGRYDMAASEPVVVSYSPDDNFAQRRWSYLVRPRHWGDKAANEQLKSLR